ncbi:MAG: iron-sulfur cluster assembly scaffold protein [Thermodesulfobacteriota bacterium]|nr:iron-sulfur cluster assembly scaffold protein [Thermodesulfobacteriota bacterium]
MKRTINMFNGQKNDLDKTIEEIQESIIEDARETFSEEVVNRWLNPKNIGKMDNPDGHGKITGPCGDTMEVSLNVKNNRIVHAMFLTDGCGTTIAAGSMITDLAIGKSMEQAFRISQEMVLDALGGLPEDSVHCALLASNTLKEAIKEYWQCKKDPWKRSYRK